MGVGLAGLSLEVVGDDLGAGDEEGGRSLGLSSGLHEDNNGLLSLYRFLHQTKHLVRSASHNSALKFQLYCNV